MKDVLKCYEQNPFDFGPVKRVLEQYRQEKGALIPVLQKVQNDYGYLPRQALECVAETLKIPLSRVFGVATFYAQFHLEPRGQYIIRVCQGTACHIRGGAKILQRLAEELGIEEGDTTEDKRFSLQKVACIGCCALAPAIMINNDTYGRLTPESVAEILKAYRE